MRSCASSSGSHSSASWTASIGTSTSVTSSPRAIEMPARIAQSAIALSEEDGDGMQAGERPSDPLGESTRPRLEEREDVAVVRLARTGFTRRGAETARQMGTSLKRCRCSSILADRFRRRCGRVIPRVPLSHTCARAPGTPTLEAAERMGREMRRHEHLGALWRRRSDPTDGHGPRAHARARRSSSSRGSGWGCSRTSCAPTRACSASTRASPSGARTTRPRGRRTRSRRSRTSATRSS